MHDFIHDVSFIRQMLWVIFVWLKLLVTLKILVLKVSFRDNLSWSIAQIMGCIIFIGLFFISWFLFYNQIPFLWDSQVFLLIFLVSVVPSPFNFIYLIHLLFWIGFIHYAIVDSFIDFLEHCNYFGWLHIFVWTLHVPCTCRGHTSLNKKLQMILSLLKNFSMERQKSPIIAIH